MEEKEKPNYYAILPADVRYDSDLKDKAKLLYAEICALSNKDGYCFATNKYFAELYNVTPTTISLLIKDLVDKGYLETEIVYKEGTKEILNRYLRIIKGGYLKNLKEGIKENLKGNNINNNNTSNNNIDDDIINSSSNIINSNNNINIYDYLQENGFILMPIHYEKIQKWKNDDLTRYAIKKAVLNGKYNINYVDKILFNWERNNITTVEQAKAQEDEFEKAKGIKDKIVKDQKVPEWFEQDLGKGGFDDDGENF